MPTGNDLPMLGLNITASTSQGAIIVPMPANEDQYYVFSLGALESGFVPFMVTIAKSDKNNAARTTSFTEPENEKLC